MIQKILFFAFFISTNISFSQEHAWVYFNSKADVANYLANPSLMLTTRAIDRRINQGITIDFTDVPVNPNHITALQNATGITYKTKSKWLNAAHVIGSVTDINALSSLPFVADIEFSDNSLNTKTSEITNGTSYINKFQGETEIATLFNYGDALNQIQMFKGDKLHEQNFTGTGIHIAVIDAGFPNVDTNPGFQRIRDNNQILGGYDFVNDNANFYTSHWHGSAVLSDIAGYLDGQFVGTAPDASFYLYISEDTSSETPVEESYWVAAAEEADRVGVDIINTSLGYKTFDNSADNYNYTTDLDGETAFISRGAAVAFSKGMIIINSAGNSGNDTSWGGRITFPADVETVLTVGAVNPSANYASFSSKGPTSDNRLKPDVVAQGAPAYAINTAGTVVMYNGTSFSSPILTGGIACLWQALPNLTNAEIVKFVKESASIFNTPTNTLGYGIPNLELALQNALSVQKSEILELILYPNPAKTTLQLSFPIGIHQATVELYNVLGKKIMQIKVQSSNQIIDITTLATGIYLAKITVKTGVKVVRIIKQ